MRYSKGYKEETRRRILEAAGRLFREKGYNGVGVDAIMAEAGLTAGGFYAHFDSKEALFSEACSAILEERNRSLQAEFEAGDESQSLNSIIKGYLSRSHRDAIAAGCPLPALTSDVARGGGEARENYEHQIKNYLSELEARMPEGGLPRRDRATALIAHLIGGLMLARALNDKQLSDHVLKVCRQTALMICEGSVEPDRQKK